MPTTRRVAPSSATTTGTGVASAPLAAHVSQRTAAEPPTASVPETDLKIVEFPVERRVIYDAATGCPPHPDDVFVRRLPHGSAMVCRKRLLERSGVGRRETTHLLLPAGAQVPESYAALLVARLRAQVPSVATSKDL